MSRCGAVGAAVALIVVGCSGDGSSGAATTVEFCTNVQQFTVLQAEGDAIFADGVDASPDQLRDVFGRFGVAVDAMVDTAPDEVAADAHVVGRTTGALIDAFAEADYDITAIATDPTFAEVLAGLDDDGVTEAQDRLSTYFRDECGVDLDS